MTLGFLLCGLILGYQWLTNSGRLRGMAEDYLSDLTGSHVTVQGATLDVFEGLRLDGVRVATDGDSAESGPLLEAGAFLVRYDPAALLRGKIEASRILAVNPVVRLTQNAGTDEWNFHDLRFGRRPPRDPDRPAPPPNLPQFLLRNARVVYLQRDGEAGQPGEVVRPLGSVWIDAQLSPMAAPADAPDADRYRFAVQTRGDSAGLGPMASGWFDPAHKEGAATLDNMVLNDDARACCATSGGGCGTNSA